MFSSGFIKHSFAAGEAPVVLKQGSRRRRLWELPAHVHCPVIGVCLSLEGLRRLAAKAAPQLSALDDYALHSAAVQAVRQRNRLAEQIQGELELRHAPAIKAMRAQRSREALEAAWQAAVGAGEIAAALWATLSHPLCDHVLAEAISQQMHMIQHQAGAALRLDIAHYRALQEENATLARALATAQQRCERQTQEKAQELAEQQARQLQLRSDLISREQELSALREELAVLRTEQPDPVARRRLEHQLNYQAQRNASLSLDNARLHRAMDALQEALLKANAAQREAQTEHLAAVACAPAAQEASLEGHRILCVGGRVRTVSVYRGLIEQAGGLFMHHDGGQEDRFGQLDYALGAADLVICQTGCISHNAYWRVKDHCKRTGKRCAFVENPSASSLARGLQYLLRASLEQGTPSVQTEATDSGAANVEFEKTSQEHSL